MEIIRSEKTEIQASMKMTFVAWTDGACEPNPGRGGWGARIEQGSAEVVEVFGGERQTTNNRMEMQAVIEALKRTPPGASVDVRSDSRYVVDGVNSWRHKWARYGWKRSKNAAEQVKNADLWTALAALCDARTVQAIWVKGHDGIAGNERADALADLGRAIA